MSTNDEKKKTNGDYYARRPMEEIKAFKSRDGKSFVVQVIKTCVFPIKYVDTIVQNESPFKIDSDKREAQSSEQ